MDRKIKKISLHLFAFFRILNYIYFTLEEKGVMVWRKRIKSAEIF